MLKAPKLFEHPSRQSNAYTIIVCMQSVQRDNDECLANCRLNVCGASRVASVETPEILCKFTVLEKPDRCLWLRRRFVCFSSAECTIGAHPGLYRVYGFISSRQSWTGTLPVGLLSGVVPILLPARIVHYIVARLLPLYRSRVMSHLSQEAISLVYSFYIPPWEVLLVFLLCLSLENLISISFILHRKRRVRVNP